MDDFYKMVIDNLTFSYSSVTSFITCPYMFKLTYIDSKTRSNNWYAEFGSFMHLILEKFFKNELDIMELSEFYKDNYTKNVLANPPLYPAGISERYYNDGLKFFDEFDFDKSIYDILFIEDKVDAVLNGSKLVIKPDIILREKSSGNTILMDYKTSNPYKNNKIDSKKIEDYKKQMYLYAYFINHTTQFKIDKIKLWFVRINEFVEFDYVEEEAGDVVNWFYNGIMNIQLEEDFPHADTVKNKFFCQNLCSVSEFCEFKP